MNKKVIFISSAIGMAVAGGAAFNYNLNAQKDFLPDMKKATIVALAQGEGGGGGFCYEKMEGLQGAIMEDKTWCDTCTPRPMQKWKNPGNCNSK